MNPIEQSVLNYVRLFNENDESKQDILLESCFSEDGIIVNDVEIIKVGLMFGLIAINTPKTGAI